MTAHLLRTSTAARRAAPAPAPDAPEPHHRATSRPETARLRAPALAPASALPVGGPPASAAARLRLRAARLAEAASKAPAAPAGAGPDAGPCAGPYPGGAQAETGEADPEVALGAFAPPPAPLAMPLQMLERPIIARLVVVRRSRWRGRRALAGLRRLLAP